jgi:hypothetical protein
MRARIMNMHIMNMIKLCRLHARYRVLTQRLFRITVLFLTWHSRSEIKSQVQVVTRLTDLYCPSFDSCGIKNITWYTHCIHRNSLTNQYTVNNQRSMCYCHYRCYRRKRLMNMTFLQRFGKMTMREIPMRSEVISLKNVDVRSETVCLKFVDVKSFCPYVLKPTSVLI